MKQLARVFGLSLVLLGGACSTSYRKVPLHSLEESRDLSVVLSMSDTLFNLEQLQNCLTLWDSKKDAGEAHPCNPPALQITGTVYNAGPGVYVPVPKKDGIEPSFIVYRDGVDLREVNERFRKGTITTLTVGRPVDPCKGYDKKLVWIGHGETVCFTLPWQLVLTRAATIDYNKAASFHLDIEAGVYDMGIVLEGECQPESDKPVWVGRSTSNRVQFRIAGE